MCYSVLLRNCLIAIGAVIVSATTAVAQPQWSSWAGLGGGITQIATAVNQDGRIELFAIGTDKALNHIWQITPGGPWSGWAGLGGGITQIATAVNQDGRIEVFAIGTDTALNHIWQTSPGGPWSGWAGLSGGITQIASAVNKDGRIEVFAIGTDTALNHIWQTSPGGPWSGWAGLSGGITQIATAVNKDGRIEVFAIGTDTALNHIWQTSPGGPWSGWAGLSGGITQIATAVNKDGRIEVFAIGTDTALNHIWQTSPGGPWSGWAGLSGGITQIATAVNKDGRVEVFAIGTDKALNHIWQQLAWGFADLHAHPASHLAFGADGNGNNGIFWGKPGLELSSSSSDAAIAADLPPCAPDSHSGFDADTVRHQTHTTIISMADSLAPWPHGASGYPLFHDWPAALSVDHQQMHITEIRRAYDGGLRLMIASATDNQLLSDLWQHIGFNLWGNPIPVPNSSFDFNSAVRQLTFIQALVSANSSWMQIVTTPAEARQAINNNRLAVILSVELDSLSADQIMTLVNAYQVRQVIPVHVANNSIGGTAIYGDTFNSNNYFLNGSFYGVSANKCVSFRLGIPDHLVHGPVGAIVPQPIGSTLFATLGYDTDPGLGGHENNMGLNNSEFLRLMRAGLLLDIAHMGEKSADDALTLAEKFGYPLMDSHTGLRDDSDCSKGVPPGVNERSLPFSQVKRIARLGGVLGLGTARNEGPDAVAAWLKDYQVALDLMGGKGVALGTDMNGLSPQIFNNFHGLPTTYPITIASRFNPPAEVSTPALSNFRMGLRTFDFAQDGIANIGLLPDFLQAVSEHPDLSWSPCNAACQSCVQAQCRNITPDSVSGCIQSCKNQNPSPSPTPNPAAIPALNALYHSAEDVIEMWEKAETAAKRIPQPEAVQCSVFDDGYANLAGPSDAIYIKGGLQACIPDDSPVGICRKWFGRCHTATTGVPVYFYVFDDGAQNMAGWSDAIYIHQQNGLKSCIPDGSPDGICRKWFGEGAAQDGRTVRCSVFDDGYSNQMGQTDTIYFLGILNLGSSNQPKLEACMPDGYANGTCRKWFGKCEAF